MASLNTLRTKYGVILSVIIILALLAFIISLGPEMGLFGSNDPTVAVIDGDKIGYMEYVNEYDTAKAYNNVDESSEEGVNALADLTWQALVAKHMLVPGFNEMGIEVSDAERMSMISGEHPSQVFYNAFANPQTGEYSVEGITNFLTQVSSNPQYQSMWNYMNTQAMFARLTTKYMGLIKAGTFANKLEVEQGLAAANERRNGRMVAVAYNTVADSLVNISDAEIEKYYNAHKKDFAKLPTRTISYVVFDVEPTDNDMVEVEKKAMAMGEEFAAAEDVRAFVRKNMGTIALNYVKAANLPEEEAVLAEGKQYGPVLKGNEWVISRPVNVVMAPDSIGLKHILLDAQNPALADSLYNALKGGADFEEAAKNHSAYAETAQNGGDLGVAAFSALNPDLAEVLATAKKGDIVKTTISGVTQIFKITRVDAAKKYVLAGTVNIPVEPSSETRRNVHNQVSVLSVDGKGSIENFNTAAGAAAVTPRTITFAQGERAISGLENSREVIRWAYGAKEQEISEIFNLGDAYVVAMVTKIDNSEYTSLSQASANIYIALLRDKKFDLLKEKLAGATLEEVAKNAGVEITSFTNAGMDDFGVGDLIIEPRVVGAVATTAQTGTISAPVKGLSNAVVFVVDDIVKSDARTAEAERVRLQATNENINMQTSPVAMQQMAKLEDLRGQYF